MDATLAIPSIGLTLFCLITSMSIYEFYEKILKDLPTPADLIAQKPIMTTKIYDRTGTILLFDTGSATFAGNSLTLGEVRTGVQVLVVF